MASIGVGPLGDYLREQRRSAQYSRRLLAEAAGVPNAYLSQIERGLRKPSAEVLQQIARALRVSADTLSTQADVLDEPRGEQPVVDAICADGSINERQKRVLLELYDGFCKENAGSPSA